MNNEALYGILYQMPFGGIQVSTSDRREALCGWWRCLPQIALIPLQRVIDGS